MLGFNLLTSSRKAVGFRRIRSTLEPRYGLNRHHNLRDAFWELIFIIVSLRTTERVYLPIFKSIRKTFPTVSTLASARLEAIELILRPAGLSRLKSWQIRNAAKVVLRDFGERRLTSWGRKHPSDLEDYLCNLPGVARKVAKCVTMYACDARSLPVDAHVWRVLSRLGQAPGGRLTERRAMELEARVPEDLRYSVHVLCISHGRKVCGKRPQCGTCPLISECPTAGRFSQ